MAEPGNMTVGVGFFTIATKCGKKIIIEMLNRVSLIRDEGFIII